MNAKAQKIIATYTPAEDGAERLILAAAHAVNGVSCTDPDVVLTLELLVERLEGGDVDALERAEVEVIAAWRAFTSKN